MKEHTTSPDEPVTYAAARFATKLGAGEMLPKDYDHLEEWLALDPRHLVEFERMLDAWHTVKPDSLALAIQPTVALQRSPPFGRSMLWKRVAAVSVLLGVLLVVAVGSISFNPDTLTGSVEVYRTTIGEQDQIFLADGSSVILNTETQLLVDYSDQQRRLDLSYGQVYFTIKRDPARPAIIRAGDHSISVLGTSFSIHKDENTMSVAVQSGRVSVVRIDAKQGSKPDRSSSSLETPVRTTMDVGVVLNEGDGAIFWGATDMTPLSSSKFDRSLDWRFGRIKFDNETLSSVVAEVNRYNAKKIVIEDQSVADTPVSGVFQVNNIEIVLTGIETALQTEILRYPDRYVIIGKESALGPEKLRSVDDQHLRKRD